MELAAQYPQIAPPSVAVRASYPGASAQTVANTVTQVIALQPLSPYCLTVS